LTYRGQIKNGVAVLDNPAALPDGTRVRVEVDPQDGDFWTNKTAAESAREQGVAPLTSADDLAGDWPTEDTADDFLAFIREVRR
jgi:hypothetical protein